MKPAELLNGVLRYGRGNREVAMIEWFRARNHGNPAVPEQTLRFEQLSIAVEKTRGINLSGGKCQSCIPLTPDVVAVLASEHVEDSHGEITVGIQAVRA